MSLALIPRRNCWQLAHARRASLLIDAQAYFDALKSAIQQARSKIIILAWDIDTRIRMGDQCLGDVLEEALDRNPELHVYVLCWNFSLIYVFERQLFPQYQKPFRHPRVHLMLDGLHPFGASQHQKIVVIDDELAFVGGLDLCSRRWDTREHLAMDPRRLDVSGRPYAPFHDLQAVVDGEAARALGSLARQRWQRLTGERIPLADSTGLPIAALWPEGVEPMFRDTEVALARTMWPENGQPALHEVEQLYIDSIRAARKHVYIENQYFTSERIASIVIERLQKADCPEFLIVLPRENSGWKEQSTMGVVRQRLIERVRLADVRGRVRFLYPVVNSDPPVQVNLHAKLMIIDDELLRTGSSNLSNRSMGMDAECDIAIAAQGRHDISASIRRIRSSLLAEHLGVDESCVEEALSRSGSLFKAVDQIRAIPGRSHDLLILEPWINPWADMLIPRSDVIDPSEPSRFETIVTGVLFAVSGLGVLFSTLYFSDPNYRR